jgi:hypothetical protein
MGSDAVAIVHLQRTERPDSIEIGTPGRGGTLKVYFDSGDTADAEKRIRNAFYLREIAAGLQEARGTGRGSP